MNGIQGEIARIHSLSKQDVAAATESSYIQFDDGKRIILKTGWPPRC